MKREYQLLVIGAGPAGMAAAQTAASHGVDVALVDEQAQPGGQIYRDVDSGRLDPDLLGKDYGFGNPLVQAFRQARLDYLPDTRVWYLDRDRDIGLLRQGQSRRIAARRIIIAAGAQERPMPFPGWQLPGVMSAGAGQILLKSAAMVPRDGVVLAGSGVLMLLLAWQYLRAGVPINAIVDTTPAANRLHALRFIPRALAASDYLFKGMRLMLSIRRARVPWYRNATGLEAKGEDRLQAVSFRVHGELQRIETRLLLLHQGLIPALHMPQAADCKIEWNEIQQCWQPVLDAWGETSQPGIFVAGDGAGISGARAATLSGQLAGLQAAHQLGYIDRGTRDRRARPIFYARARHLAIRPLLDAWYRVPDNALIPPDETLVCRCEEVSVDEIRDLAALGCIGPNQAKAFSRCGMGPCQGRFCASTLEFILARELGLPVRDIGHLRARPPLAPVTLGQLARTEPAG